MQFYEATSFGLRVATHLLENREQSNIRIRLLPMIHIGSAEFYKAVEAFLAECDYILYEGVAFKHGQLKLKNRERMARKLDLVTQKEGFNLKAFKGKLIHSDFKKDSGKAAWDKLELYDKFIFNVVYPIRIFFQDYHITREKLVKYFMKSNTDLDIIFGMPLDRKDKIKGFLDDDREKILFDKLDKMHSMQFQHPTQIGIVYGAGHMTAIARYIFREYKYKNIDAEFIEVFKVV